MAKGNEARVLDVFGPNFLIETNGPVGVGGGIAYQIYSVNDKDYVWQQALHQSGLATMEADGSLQIQTGYKNKEGDVSYVAMAHNGDMAITAENGWVRIYGKNIVLEAANELVLQGAKVTVGNVDNTTQETRILGQEISIGSNETRIVEVVGSKRITRQSSSIFLKHPTGQFSVFAGVAQAAFLGPLQKSRTKLGEFKGGQ